MFCFLNCGWVDVNIDSFFDVQYAKNEFGFTSLVQVLQFCLIGYIQSNARLINTFLHLYPCLRPICCSNANEEIEFDNCWTEMLNCINFGHIFKGRESMSGLPRG